MTITAVQGGLAGTLFGRFGERRVVLTCLLATVLQFLLLAAARQTPLIFLGLLLGAVGDLAYTSVQAFVSRQVGAAEQGQVAGAMGSLSSLTALVGALLATQVRAGGAGAGDPVADGGGASRTTAGLKAVGTGLEGSSPESCGTGGLARREWEWSAGGRLLSQDAAKDRCGESPRNRTRRGRLQVKCE